MKMTNQTTNGAAPMQAADNEPTLAGQFHVLRHFIGHGQLAAMIEGLKSEEGKWFRAKIGELFDTVQNMPKSYETDGQGMRAVAHLRYFAGGSAAWLITERDAGALNDIIPGKQHQAFGHGDLFGDGGELGYISISEIIAEGGELDLYFTPKPLLDAVRHETPDAITEEAAA